MRLSREVGPSIREWTDLHRLGQDVFFVGMAPFHVSQGRGLGETGAYSGRFVVVRGHWRAGITVSEGVASSSTPPTSSSLQFLGQGTGGGYCVGQPQLGTGLTSTWIVGVVT